MKNLKPARRSGRNGSGLAVVALLFVYSVAAHADDKKKNNQSSPPPKSAPVQQQHSAPPPSPVVHSQPSHYPSTTPPPAGRNPGGYQPNTNSTTGHQGGNERAPNSNVGVPGGNQPHSNINTGRQGEIERNTGRPGYVPNTVRQGGYQPSPNAPRAPNMMSPGGFTTGRTRGGGEVRPLAGGRTEYHGPNNTRAEFRRDGTVHEVHARGMVITHGPVGTRRIVTERADHTRIVTYGRERGYVQRSYTVSGREYFHRTYYVHGVAYSRVYRPYHYGGVAYYRYVPAVYYRPAFYGWVYSPWSTPVFYRWGWVGSPWYLYYGGYFSPYPSYPSAGLWLTDYMLASNLQDGYQQHAEANVDMSAPAAYNQGGLTLDVKQAIADEVQRQLVQERAESQTAQNPGGAGSSDAPPFSDNGSHIFVVSANLDVTASDIQQCSVTPGDVLGMNGVPPLGATAANVRVMASKEHDCQQGSVVAVSLEDLQEMQNHMREVIDQGLSDLQSGQGQGGLPTVPPQARGELQSPVVAAAPQPDTNASAELNEQDRLASQTEHEVVSEAAPEGMPQPSGRPQPAGTPSVVIQQTPITISLGQTPDEVIALLGQPEQVVNLGAKKMFVYPDMKITFVDGKVTDVQ